MNKKSVCKLLHLLLVLLSSCAVSQSLKAQSSETFYVKAKLGPDNQSALFSAPDAKGSARIKIMMNRDSSGNVLSGALVFDVGYQFSGPVNLTALHVHSGVVGEMGPV